VSRRLDRTALIGAANVSHAAGGAAFPTVLAHWGLANYVSDLSLPGFTVLFSNSAGGALRATLVPRLNMIRLQ